MLRRQTEEIAFVMNLPEIKRARLRLRPFTLDDVGDVHSLWTDPDVRRYLWDDEVISLEHTTRIIADSPNLASSRVMEKAGMQFERRACSGGLDTVYCAISRGSYNLRF